MGKIPLRVVFVNTSSKEALDQKIKDLTIETIKKVVSQYENFSFKPKHRI